MKLDAYCPKPTYIEDEEELRKSGLLGHIHEAQKRGVRVAIDTETTGLDKMKEKVVVWSICYNKNSRYVLPTFLLYRFKELFKQKSYKWVFTNAKFDLSMLKNSGFEIDGRIYDTLIMDWLLDPDKHNVHDLKSCAWRHLNIRMKSFIEVFGRPKKGESQGNNVANIIYGDDSSKREDALDYASMDAWATFKLSLYFERLLKERGTWKHIEELYVPLVRVLWHMERRGVRIDKERLENLRAPMMRKIIHIESEINKAAGKVVNPRSPKQLRELFFDTLGLEPIKFTKGGESGIKNPSVDAYCLQQWADTVPIAKMLLEHRMYSKLVSTYIDGILKRITPEGRIHTTFNAHITATGRLSSSGPNLQNIPARIAEGKEIRACFITDPDKKVIVLDYSQVEMMIAAHFSGDHNMLSFIREGKDLHSGTAAIMFNEDYEEIFESKQISDNKGDLTEKQKDLLDKRRRAKNIGFGVLYGMGPFRLSQDLEIDVSEAKQLIRKFFSRFPDVDNLIKNSRQSAISNGVITTILNRPRYIHAARASGAEKEHALRQAVNTPIQGTAADIIGLAMILIDNDAHLQKLGCKLLLQVHDELVLEVPEENVDEAQELIKYYMENPGIELSVPLKAAPGIGNNWMEAK